jgi:hypothetical protein
MRNRTGSSFSATFSAECRFERCLLLRAGGSPPHDPASVWKDCQYLFRSRHRHHTSQHRRIPGRKLGLRFGQSGGHSTHEDAGARTRPPWDQCDFCYPWDIFDAADSINPDAGGSSRAYCFPNEDRRVESFGAAGRTCQRCVIPGVGRIELYYRPYSICGWRPHRSYVTAFTILV